MQNKPIIYKSLTVASKNGLDIEVTWNVENLFGKLAGSGELEKAMREALNYNSRNGFSHPDVTEDLTRLFELAEATNWNWDSTRIAAVQKAAEASCVRDA